MKTYRELVIRGPKPLIDELIEQIDQVLDSGWQRHEPEKHLSKDFVCYMCTQQGKRKEAVIYFGSASDGELSLANTIPTDSPSLTIDEYNLIVEEFYRKFVSSIGNKLKLEVTLTKGEKDIEDSLNQDAASKLKRFSEMANKTTGSAHPYDQERWHAFLIAAHETNAELDAATLEQWLSENGWSTDRASDLTVEYEKGLALLSQYDRRGS